MLIIRLQICNSFLLLFRVNLFGEMQKFRITFHFRSEMRKVCQKGCVCCFIVLKPMCFFVISFAYLSGRSSFKESQIHNFCCQFITMIINEWYWIVIYPTHSLVIIEGFCLSFVNNGTYVLVLIVAFSS